MKSMHFRLATLFALFAILALSSVSVQCAEIDLERDILYGQAGDTKLKLDLAKPEGDGPFPAIVFIHGGGWLGGHRNAYRSAIEEAARRGYVAVTISYRLVQFEEPVTESTKGDPIFPAQVHDAKAAVRWLRANAEKYDVDPERIGVTGASAGGHLSLMVGLTDAEDGLEGDSGSPDQSSRVQAVVNMFGPTELASAHETSSVAWMVRLFLGGTPNEVAKRYEKASPVTYIDEGDPPILTLQGDEDTLVPVEQARLLDRKMEEAGASHTLIVLEGQGHGFKGDAFTKSVAATWEFFDKHLKRTQ